MFSKRQVDKGSLRAFGYRSRQTTTYCSEFPPVSGLYPAGSWSFLHCLCSTRLGTQINQKEAFGTPKTCIPNLFFIHTPEKIKTLRCRLDFALGAASGCRRSGSPRPTQPVSYIASVPEGGGFKTQEFR